MGSLKGAVKVTRQVAGDCSLLILEQLGRVLPHGIFLRLDGIIGNLVRGPGDKPAALTMMKAMLGTGQRTEAEWEGLWQRHVRVVGHLTIRHLQSFTTPVPKLLADLEVEGAGQIKAALDSGKGAVLLCSHTGHFLAQLLVVGSLGREAWAFGNPLPYPRTEERFRRFCRTIGIDRRPVGRGHSIATKDLLNRQGLVVTFCDVTTVPRNNAWVPFGQTETLVNLGPALLGLRNNVPLFVLTSRSLPTGRAAVRVHPLLTVTRTSDLLSDAFDASCEAMAIISEAVRNCPEQWWQWNTGCYRTADGESFGHPGPFEIHELTAGCYERGRS